MKVLVLHNNNLPEFLLRSAKLEDVNVKSISVALPETDVPDFDSHISQKMVDEYGANLIKECYDIIILPYNTTENDLEYTGLRILAHLRVTREWNCMATPIMFLGPDTLLEVNQFCELGGLLNTFNVFTSSITKQEDLITKLRWIKNETKTIESIETTPEYKAFLKRMKSLSAPANYTSHHSLANEWAIMRWNDMMSRPVDLPDNGFTHILYYKYLRALYGVSQGIEGIKQEHESIEIIKGIESGKKLVLIDDEWEKGWATILNHIAESSGFDFKSCDIKKEWNRNTLIKKVRQFIDEHNKDTDCFLLDLRLHDNDFKENESEKANLTGFEILDYIKKKNKANPVVIFSASNKIWNLQHVTENKTKGAIGYVLKETPESALNARESFKLYEDFVKAIKVSFQLSKLKPVVEKQSELKKIFQDVESLDEFVNLTLLDKGTNNNSFLKACSLILMTFLEEYLKKRFFLQKDDNTKITQLFEIEHNCPKGDVTCRVSTWFDEDNSIKETNFTKNKERYRKPFTEPFKDIGLIISSLYLVYNLNVKDVNDYFVPIRNARNIIAHTSKKINITFDQLYDFYFKIIVPVIEHDHKK